MSMSVASMTKMVKSSTIAEMTTETESIEMNGKSDGVNGFYVYFVEYTCFDCGQEDKTILGWYKGELNKETLTKIAKSYVKNNVIPYKENQLTVTDWSIIADNGFSKTVYETEAFTLKEVE